MMTVSQLIKENITADREEEKRALELVIDFWDRLEKGVSEDYWKLVILEAEEIEYTDELKHFMWIENKEMIRENEKILEAIWFLQGYLRQKNGDIF